MKNVTTATLVKRFPGVSFGTSGVRALVSDLTAQAVSAYTAAFVQRMCATGHLKTDTEVLVGMDLRPSSPRIVAEVCHALAEIGCRARFLGALPTPALALECLAAGAPGVMVTGSHIPFDRNGIKFYSPVGEILKSDEQAISDSPPQDFEFSRMAGLPSVDDSALLSYANRYTAYFGRSCLSGYRVGVYEHSAVGRELIKSILDRLGATVISLGRSDGFVPVDTEAVGEADLAQARSWCKVHQLDVVVSTDGDGDRPLVFDENGEFVRGDLLGLMCARDLGIQCLVVPVNCNTAVELSGAFPQVFRTRIGSPFVIECMAEMNVSLKRLSVAGFEANGGFLLGTSLPGLIALPTRDALLPVLSLLRRSNRAKLRISSLVAELPCRHTYSDRIKDFPNDRSRILLENLTTDFVGQCKIAGKTAPPVSIDVRDGLRMLFSDGDIVHLRASGNAPELRCYAESTSIDVAKGLCIDVLARALSTS